MHREARLRGAPGPKVMGAGLTEVGSMIAYDIVFVTDLSFPGGTSTSLLHELRAAKSAGLSLAIQSIRTARLARRRMPNSDLIAVLKATETPLLPRSVRVSASLLLYCHPYLLETAPTRASEVSADVVGLLAHHPLRDRTGIAQFDMGRAIQMVRDLHARDLVILPVSKTVRRSFADSSFCGRLWERDWRNLINAAEWPRAAPWDGQGPMRIGRHSRPDLLKWPEPQQARCIYPEDPAFEFHMLGVDQKIREKFEPWPTNWYARGFERGGTARFLCGLHGYSYFHAGAWIEAFGYNVIEAMAVGLPVVLPEHFRETFGDAALYAAPTEAAETYRQLVADCAAAKRAGNAARDFAEREHGYASYAERFEALMGRPSIRASRPRRSLRAPLPERILTVTSNGVGAGHISRQIAIARALPPGVQTIFFSLSKAARFAAEAGFVTEHRAFHRQINAEPALWNHWFAEELAEALRFYRPEALVFDGNMPYAGLIEAMERTPSLVRIWVRRGLWRRPDATAIERGGGFDLVIEPGDLAQAQAPGYERRDSGDVLLTDPILSVNPADALERATARRLLDLPADAEIALVQLGAGNNYDMSQARTAVLERIMGTANWHAVELVSPVRAETVTPIGPRHHIRTVYPAAIHLRAFEFVVGAAGYNSFHEIVATGTPCLYVPNCALEMDLQECRADYASICGWGLSARADDPYGLIWSLARLLTEPGLRDTMRDRLNAVQPAFYGAEQAAAGILHALRTAPASRH